MEQMQYEKPYSKLFIAFFSALMEEKLWSANAFQDVVANLSKQAKDKEFFPVTEMSSLRVPPERLKQKAALRELDGYLKILGGV